MASRVILAPADLALYFLYNPVHGFFDTRSFTAAATDHRVTFGELSTVLRPIQNLCLPMIKKNSNISLGLALFCVAWFGIYVAIIIILNPDNAALTKFLVISFWVVFFIVAMICYRAKAMLKKRMIRQSQDILDHYNPTFIQKGLRWYIPDSFPTHIELWKEYMMNIPEHVPLLDPVINPFVVYKKK